MKLGNGTFTWEIVIIENDCWSNFTFSSEYFYSLSDRAISVHLILLQLSRALLWVRLLDWRWRLWTWWVWPHNHNWASLHRLVERSPRMHCPGLESHLGKLFFFLGKKSWLGSSWLVYFPLPFYLVTKHVFITVDGMQPADYYSNRLIWKKLFCRLTGGVGWWQCQTGRGGVSVVWEKGVCEVVRCVLSLWADWFQPAIWGH